MTVTLPAGPVAFQGWPGAYSDLACRAALPGRATLPCPGFEDAFAAVREGRAALAMIPIENSIAGRVADSHALLPEGGLSIVGEHFQPVRHGLLALPGVALAELRTAHSHVQALGQCRERLRALGLTPVVEADTAGSARMVAQAGDRTRAAVASALAAELNGLAVLVADLQDHGHNTTRFVILAREPAWPALGDGPAITSLAFRVRSIPAALYKALGGFATNGVNLTRLESAILDGRFESAAFQLDIEGHPNERRVGLALDELRYFAERVVLLGVYPAHPFRGEVSGSVTKATTGSH